MIKQLEKDLALYKYQNQQLTKERHRAEQVMEETLTKNAEPPSKQVVRQYQTAKCEKTRLAELIHRIQSNVLKGAAAERIVGKMMGCSLQMARSDADKEAALQEIDRLEVKLATAAEASDEKPTKGSQMQYEDTAATKLTTIRRVKSIRSDLTAKESLVKELEDRAALEADKLRALEMELRQHCLATDAGHFFSRAAG